jgi:hypothetical protein
MLDGKYFIIIIIIICRCKIGEINNKCSKYFQEKGIKFAVVIVLKQRYTGKCFMQNIEKLC